jgi:hypothetical protein
VLVQWQGLPADDTSWEDWENLKADYHLEDKVLLDDVGNVSKENTAEVGHNVTNERPKRKVNLPKHLEDFVVGANNSVRKN